MSWRKRIQWFLLIVAWFAIGWFARGLVLPPIDQELALVSQAGQIITHEYYGDVPAPRQMTYAAIAGMLAGIGDKYAAFFEPAAAARDGIEARGSDATTGLRGEMRDGAFEVIEVLPNEPAARAGLQVGDVIAEIDGWKVPQAAAYSEVIAMLRGSIGTTAQLVVRRGDQNLMFAVPREPAQDVITQTLGSDIAYLRLDRFTDQTPQQVEQALKQLLANKPRGLIWDLRYNGGGLMNATQQVLDLFLDEGVAFYARTKDGNLIPYKTSSGGIAEKIPLVVLIGPHTYSAPETAAASIADRGRGKLIGEQTHGKGSILTTIGLADGSAIRMTVARWLSPVHQTSYEGNGVLPDIVVKDDPGGSTDAVLESAVDYLRHIQP